MGGLLWFWVGLLLRAVLTRLANMRAVEEPEVRKHCMIPNLGLTVMQKGTSCSTPLWQWTSSDVHTFLQSSCAVTGWQDVPHGPGHHESKLLSRQAHQLNQWTAAINRVCTLDSWLLRTRVASIVHPNFSTKLPVEHFSRRKQNRTSYSSINTASWVRPVHTNSHHQQTHK